MVQKGYTLFKFDMGVGIEILEYLRLFQTKRSFSESESTNPKSFSLTPEQSTDS